MGSHGKQWQRLKAFRTRQRDGLTTTAAAAVWLLEGAGAAFQHVLTATTVTYDEAEHCPMRPRAWTDSQAIGGGHRGRQRLRCKVIAYMKNRVPFPLIQ